MLILIPYFSRLKSSYLVLDQECRIGQDGLGYLGAGTSIKDTVGDFSRFFSKTDRNQTGQVELKNVWDFLKASLKYTFF